MKNYTIRDYHGVELLGVFAKTEKQALSIASKVLHIYETRLLACPVNHSISKRRYVV